MHPRHADLVLHQLRTQVRGRLGGEAVPAPLAQGDGGRREPAPLSASRYTGTFAGGPNRSRATTPSSSSGRSRGVSGCAQPGQPAQQVAEATWAEQQRAGEQEAPALAAAGQHWS